jgi:hypothetical protein
MVEDYFMVSIYLLSTALIVMVCERTRLSQRIDMILNEVREINDRLNIV